MRSFFGGGTPAIYKGALDSLDDTTKAKLKEQYGSNEAIFNDEANAFYAAEVMGEKGFARSIATTKPKAFEKIMNFFKDAINYKNDGYSKAARKYYKEYKAMYEAFSAVNKGNNALEGAEGGKRYSIEADSYSRIMDMQTEVNKLRKEISEFESTDDFKARMKDLSDAIGNNDIENGIKAYNKWKKESGYEDLLSKRDSLQGELERLRKEYNDDIQNQAAEKEKSDIAKSGLSEAEYFRKQAVKEFGYTPYFYDAGYLLPNGKMLNFSGEKGKHFGSRGQDHRAIGVIYANETGGEALLKFMSEGNIRIMAESPGIDIYSLVEPTKEQYATIRKFINDYADKEFFSVDLTDENGREIGSLQYENRINPTRIINDIKHFYETGEIREQSNVDRFRFSLDIDSIDISQYNDITLPKDELGQIQSEGLTWDANRRNQILSKTFVKDGYDVTIRYWISDSGIVHPVVREVSNYKDWRTEYGNRNSKGLDNAVKSLRIRRGYNSISGRSLQNGRESREIDSRNNRQIRSEGRSDGTRHTKNGTDVGRTPKGRSELIKSTDENYFKALDRNEKLKAQSMIYDASRESMGNPDGQEAAIIIKDAHKKDGSTIDFANAILDGNKKGEVRKFKTLTRKWVGISKDGKVIGRVRFGEPIILHKGTQEYSDSLIEGTEYDIVDGETKYYYPVEEVMDLRDDPRKYYHNKGVYGFYSFKETDAITYDDNGNIIPPSERFNLKNKDRRHSLDISSIREQTEGKVHAEAPEAYKPSKRESISSGWTGLQIALTNAQAGIEKIGKKFGIKDIETRVQTARAAINQAQMMIGGEQWEIGVG